MLGAFLTAFERWPSRHRGLAATLLLVLLSILLLMTPLGCSTTVIPPARVTDPVEVYLVDHGRTPSLVLPRPGGGMARYVYGDWDWYALGRTNLFNGLAALLLPTRGALGRELLEGPGDVDVVQYQISVVIEHMYPLIVERERAESLERRLDEYFERSAGTLVHNPDQGLDFVHHPDRYTYFWNSNHQVAGWLRELGCEVRGPSFNSIWDVRRPRAGGP